MDTERVRNAAVRRFHGGFSFCFFGCFIYFFYSLTVASRWITGGRRIAVGYRLPPVVCQHRGFLMQTQRELI